MEAATTCHLDWAGGMFDGDGTVLVNKQKYKLRLRVAVGKAEKGLCVCEKFKEMFGGGVYFAASKSASVQPVYTWVASGESAVKFCQLLAPHCHLKKRQLELASQFPVGSTDIHLCHDTKSARSAIHQQLKEMKQLEHTQIAAGLSLPYMAGLIDADGCLVVVSSKSVCLSASQKFSAICHALQKELGGSVYCCKNSYVWKITKGAMSVIEALQPHLLEKKQQADLILAMNHSNLSQTLLQLKGLKGLQRHTTPVMHTVQVRDSVQILEEGIS
jgi:hypothetical protein